MKNIFFLLIMALFAGCKDKEPPATSSAINPAAEKLALNDSCLVKIETLEGNQYVDYTNGEQIVLRATDAADWQLEVYNLKDCSMKAAYQLPENFSLDYPYFLADINYNTSQRMIGIRGYKTFYVVDLDGEQLSQPITPKYKEDRLMDVESGVIQHLEVWEDYLVGIAQDWGPFVFQLDSSGARAVMPAVDFKTEAGEYRCLFLIEDDAGDFQAILPTLSQADGSFLVNALFPTPRPIDPAATVFAEGSPYVRLKDKTGQVTGVNLYTGELLPVINEVE